MSANEYVNTLFQYISDLFKRPPFLDCKNGVFPEEFVPTVKNIFKRLFRVYSHVYHHHLNVRVVSVAHLQEFIRTGAEAHLNTSFKHFVLFEREYGLVSRKEDQAPHSGRRPGGRGQRGDALFELSLLPSGLLVA